MDATERFGDRVDHYVRHRPGYPAALVAWLHDPGGVRADARVADIGAGTGISSRLLLDAGHPVIAVEPNAPMRAAAQAALAGYAGFRAVEGRADATGLADASVDLVIAAQAFHWFDRDAVRTEWARILVRGGSVAIFWNTRRTAGSAFAEGYEQVLATHAVDYVPEAARGVDDAAMRAWFGAGLRAAARFDNVQRLAFDDLVGRTLSSSYAPLPGNPRHAGLVAALRRLFDATQVDGHVDMAYDTRIYVGRLDDAARGTGPVLR